MDDHLLTVASNSVRILDSNAEKLFFKSVESDDDETYFISNLIKKPNKNMKKSKVKDYIEITVSLYSDLDFKPHFQMSRKTIEILMQKFPKHESAQKGRPPVSLKKIVLSLIWTLANQESFRGIADRFSLSKSHIHRTVVYFCSELNKSLQNLLGEKAKSVIFQFKKKDFPGVIGTIDGTHIPIKPPLIDSGGYYNRKGYHSVVLQAICDYKTSFIDVFAGWPGSSNDSRILKRSSIYNELCTNKDKLPGNCHLLGDAAYILEIFLLPLYKDNGHLSRKQIKYNVIHSSTTWVIERTFGILKGHSRRLKFMDMSCLDLISKFIITACILHNICIEENDASIYDDDIETESPVNNDVGEDVESTSITKRDCICNYLSICN